MKEFPNVVEGQNDTAGSGAEGLKIFHIFHTVTLAFEPIEDNDFRYVASIEARSLEDAWYRTNNVFQQWNPERPTRSSCIGDLFISADGAYLVDFFGFKKIEKRVVCSDL